MNWKSILETLGLITLGLHIGLLIYDTVFVISNHHTVNNQWNIDTDFKQSIDISFCDFNEISFDHFRYNDR